MADYTSPSQQLAEKGNQTSDVIDALRQMTARRQQAEQFQQQLAQPGQLQQQKAELEAQAQAEQLKQAQQVIDQQAGSGRKVNAKVGGVDISEAQENPLKYLFMQQQRGAKATGHAYDTYMKAVPAIQQKIQNAQSGLEAINDPGQVGSVGQARTLAIKNLGMSRYNQQEGNALVPNQLASIMHSIYNFSGDGSNPLTDNQRQALNSIFNGSLQQAKQQHEIAKANAVGSLQASGLADPMTVQQFQQQIGGPLDKQLSDIQDKYKSVPHTIGYQAPNPNSQANVPHQSMLDKLKGLFQNKPNTPTPQPVGAGATSQTSPTQPAGVSTVQGQIGQNPAPSAMKVIHKASGQTGTIPPEEFDPQVYDKVQ